MGAHAVTPRKWRHNKVKSALAAVLAAAMFGGLGSLTAGPAFAGEAVAVVEPVVIETPAASAEEVVEEVVEEQVVGPVVEAAVVPKPVVIETPAASAEEVVVGTVPTPAVTDIKADVLPAPPVAAAETFINTALYYAPKLDRNGPASASNIGTAIFLGETDGLIKELSADNIVATGASCKTQGAIIELSATTVDAVYSYPATITSLGALDAGVSVSRISNLGDVAPSLPACEADDTIQAPSAPMFTDLTEQLPLRDRNLIPDRGNSFTYVPQENSANVTWTESANDTDNIFTVNVTASSATFTGVVVGTVTLSPTSTVTTTASADNKVITFTYTYTDLTEIGDVFVHPNDNNNVPFIPEDTVLVKNVITFDGRDANGVGPFTVTVSGQEDIAIKDGVQTVFDLAIMSPVVVPTYVIALWEKPSSGEFGPQRLIKNVESDVIDFGLVVPFAIKSCTSYQVDAYANDEVTAALIAGGVLNTRGNPEESWVGGYYQEKYSDAFTTECLQVIEVPELGAEFGYDCATSKATFIPDEGFVPVTSSTYMEGDITLTETVYSNPAFNVSYFVVQAQLGDITSFAVTLAPNPGYEFDEHAVVPFWLETFTNEECPVPTTPVTPPATPVTPVTPTTPPAVVAPVVTATPVAVVPKAAVLASTGGEIGNVIALAVLVLFLGVAMVIPTVRRRKMTEQ